ncbi:MAG: ribose 5-phosphate isomerase B [Lachnospiraceae bacterium]|nr:ribose 5-phosphate isomerase B [Lachnospiraceae bacterium]
MIALGCDHGGYALMQEVKKHLDEIGESYKDFGTYSTDSCDYPLFGKAAAKAVADGECEKGIVICTSGIGISIAANRYKGVRCALCHNEKTAQLCREHNNANMLAMGAIFVEPELAAKITDIFLNTPFSEGERHQRRVNEIDQDI